MNHSLAKRVLLAFTGLLTLICVVGFASTQVKYKPWGVPEHRLEEYEQKLSQIRRRQALMEGSQQAPLPSAFVAEKKFDFGIVDPGTTNEHVFIIENRGEGPLALVASETSCQCTLSEVEETVVEPGESTRVTLRWNVGQEQRQHFRQFSLIETNDPRQPEISLAVSGTVRKRLGFDPPEFVANRVSPDDVASLRTVVYSQLFEDFEITNVESNLEGFAYGIDPVTPERIDEMKAKSALLLTVTLPAVNAGGSLRDELTVTIRSTGEAAEEMQEQIVLHVDVLPRIAFYGSQLDARYGLDLGVLTQGETGAQKLVVRVRGNLRATPIQVLEVEPSCLRATLEDYKPQEGLYRLTVAVAEDAKPIAFRADQAIGYIAVGNPHDAKLQKGIPVRGQVIPEIK